VHDVNLGKKRPRYATARIAFEIVRIAKPLETHVQLRLAGFLGEIYRTVVGPHTPRRLGKNRSTEREELEHFASKATARCGLILVGCNV
jgi:hypothetical protein